MYHCKIVCASHFSSRNLNATDGINSRSPAGVLTCANFPSHFTAVEIWVGGEHISTVIRFVNVNIWKTNCLTFIMFLFPNSFETTNSISIKNELRVTASVWQKIVTEPSYTSLSKYVYTNSYV